MDLMDISIQMLGDELVKISSCMTSVTSLVEPVNVAVFSCCTVWSWSLLATYFHIAIFFMNEYLIANYDGNYKVFDP